MSFRYYAGLTSALCIVERIQTVTPPTDAELIKEAARQWLIEGIEYPPKHTVSPTSPPVYHVVYLERLERLPYPRILDAIAKAFATLIPSDKEGEDPVPLASQSQLVLGGTATSPTLFDLLYKTRKYSIIQVHLKKRDIEKTDWPLVEIDRARVVSTLQVVMQQQRIRIAGSLTESQRLQQQIQTIGLEPSEQVEDLSLALSLAVWYAEKMGSGPSIRRI